MNVCEIFHSIQGESTYSGLPCVFIRTSGCNLRCSYCDTKYAYENGTDMDISSIISVIESFNCQLVEITGGEPLMQYDEVNRLIDMLLNCKYKVLLETNGSINAKDIDPRVIKIMDLKCPDSGMSDYIYWDNLKYLTDRDQVKFVLNSRDDYNWMKGVLKEYQSLIRSEILVSTVFGSLEPSMAVRWILEDKLKVRFQLQLHKYIWDPDRRGV